MPKSPCPTLLNPYDPEGRNWESQHVIYGRVSPQDVQFLKSRFTMVTGLMDKVVATLYKKLLDELRLIDSVALIEPAFHPGHESYNILISALERLGYTPPVERSESGGPVGRPTGTDVSGGADGIHQAVQPTTPKRTKPKSSDKTRKRSGKGDKGKGTEKV